MNQTTQNIAKMEKLIFHPHASRSSRTIRIVQPTAYRITTNRFQICLIAKADVCTGCHPKWKPSLRDFCSVSTVSTSIVLQLRDVSV